MSDTLFIASKQGLWRLVSQDITQLIDQDLFDISITTNHHILVSAGKNGMVELDRKGELVKNSLLASDISVKLEGLKQKQPQTLHNLVMDLHTGEAIVGKKLMPFWIAFSGIQLLLLTLTGCWFVFKKKPKNSKVVIKGNRQRA